MNETNSTLGKQITNMKDLYQAINQLIKDNHLKRLNKSDKKRYQLNYLAYMAMRYIKTYNTAPQISLDYVDKPFTIYNLQPYNYIVNSLDNQQFHYRNYKGLNNFLIKMNTIFVNQSPVNNNIFLKNTNNIVNKKLYTLFPFIMKSSITYNEIMKVSKQEMKIIDNLYNKYKLKNKPFAIKILSYVKFYTQDATNVDFNIIKQITLYLIAYITQSSENNHFKDHNGYAEQTTWYPSKEYCYLENNELNICEINEVKYRKLYAVDYEEFHKYNNIIFELLKYIQKNKDTMYTNILNAQTHAHYKYLTQSQIIHIFSTQDLANIKIPDIIHHKEVI